MESCQAKGNPDFDFSPVELDTNTKHVFQSCKRNLGFLDYPLMFGNDKHGDLIRKLKVAADKMFKDEMDSRGGISSPTSAPLISLPPKKIFCQDFSSVITHLQEMQFNIKCCFVKVTHVSGRQEFLDFHVSGQPTFQFGTQENHHLQLQLPAQTEYLFKDESYSDSDELNQGWELGPSKSFSVFSDLKQDWELARRSFGADEAMKILLKLPFVQEYCLLFSAGLRNCLELAYENRCLPHEVAACEKCEHLYKFINEILVEDLSAKGQPSLSAFLMPYVHESKLTLYKNSGQYKRSAGEIGCTFCRADMHKTQNEWKSHVLRVDGFVSCPVLQKIVCVICGATGNDAHTISRCPMASNEERLRVREFYKKRRGKGV